jgi:hypothetical protein
VCELNGPFLANILVGLDRWERILDPVWGFPKWNGLGLSALSGKQPTE